MYVFTVGVDQYSGEGGAEVLDVPEGILSIEGI